MKHNSLPSIATIIVAMSLIISMIGLSNATALATTRDSGMRMISGVTAVTSHETDLEIITREGHPTYYGSVALSHTIWDDVEPGKILFADGFDKYTDSTILTMSAYRNSDMIRSIGISLTNFDPPVIMSIDDILPIIAEYMPFEIMDQYYSYVGSERIVPDADKDSDTYNYVITYHLTDAGKDAGYSGEHDYSGTIDVIINTNPNGTVRSFSIDFGKPRWMSSLKTNKMHSEEWACDLYDYR